MKSKADTAPVLGMFDFRALVLEMVRKRNLRNARRRALRKIKKQWEMRHVYKQVI